MTCWLQHKEITGHLKSFFQVVDDRISSDLEGNPHLHEEHVEATLRAVIQERGELLHRRLLNQRPALLIAVELISHRERAPHGHGADIGLVLKADVPGSYTTHKAVIVQSKRLHPTHSDEFTQHCEYPEILNESSSSPQWMRMLHRTSSAVYFLFNPQKIRGRTTNLGLQVMSAQQVAGAAQAGKERITASDAYRCKPFSKWMVEDFICSNIGDIRECITNLARGKDTDEPPKWTLSIDLKANLSGNQV